MPSSPPPRPSAGALGYATGLLDPASTDPETRARVRAWLAVQARFAWQPQEAVARLVRNPDPAALLRGARRPAPSDAALERDRERLAALGARLLPWVADLYPPRLQRLPDAPPLLVVRGSPETLVGRAVALVGARAPTAYGLGVARALATRLAEAGVIVISGLARGVDAEAHRAALRAGGLTVAVQGCGPDRVYPSAHRELAREIAARGAVLSELPVGAAPLAHHFPLRNRLISGLAEAVVVVEARTRSGSLVTARHAAAQGVDVLAVPGPIDAPTSRGANRLLRDGAGVVDAPETLLDALGLVDPGAASARAGAESAGGTGPAAPSHPLQRAVIGALEVGPRAPDELARQLRTAPAALAWALLELELAGRVREERDGRLRLVSPLRGPRL